MQSSLVKATYSGMSNFNNVSQLHRNVRWGIKSYNIGVTMSVCKSDSPMRKSTVNILCIS